ncbi:DNA polymerase ligase N-terminal domain-containing protein [Actinomycetospora chiangmaiensis]|uniref:DNA polymerase ligase N-terminal domain-containing protein n=1 Tax=Actinomycetospora chiangmaiensis TaxID=402650 RepID=UPI00039DEC5F|nr:DNA polymerase ligase N-terminal domain-containing protein [Actinomycetospora chiangmaiensis]
MTPRPEIPTPGDPPVGGDWAVGFAWGGRRVVVDTTGDEIRATGEDGEDLAADLPGLVGVTRGLVLDGEVVALDGQGRPAPDGTDTLTVADLLHADGEDLCDRPFDERRARLEALDCGPGTLVPPVFTDVAPAEVLAVARRHGLPGIVAVRRTALYRPGRRSPDRVCATVPGRLGTYASMRDFTVTPEPTGGAPEPGEPIFVVQRHRARRLHYDVRLEVDGALASWAVPRGPTLDPAARHLAVRTEDHPMDYAFFEGVIPAGQYGGGDVIVWDRGTWRPARTEDPAAALAAGELHADLVGEKLAGRFVFVRRADDGGRKEQWVLVHKRDDDAVDGWDPEAHPRSVLSGRTNDEVAAAPAAMWQSGAPAATAEVPLAGPTRPPRPRRPRTSSPPSTPWGPPARGPSAAGTWP